METNLVSLDKVGNRFLFVLIAAKRALQLQKGAKARVELSTKKPTVVAMAEEMANRVQFQLPTPLPGTKPSKRKKSSK